MLPSWLLLTVPTLVPVHPDTPPTAEEPVPETTSEREAAPPLDPVLVRAKRLIVRPGEELENGALLIEGGVIVAVGTDLEAPEGARTIEGEVACAGLVDGWSSLGLDFMSARDQGTLAGTRSVDAFDPYTAPEERAEALAAGVTSMRLQAGGSASIGGIGTVVRTDAGPDADVILDDACVAATVGITRNGRTSGVFDRIQEVDRLIGQIDKGTSYLEKDIEYRHELEEWQAAIAEKREELEDDFKKAKKKRDKEIEEAKEKGKEFKEDKYKEDKKPKKPRWDPNVEVLSRVANGELPLVVEAHRVPELRSLLEQSKSKDRLRLVLAGGSEAGYVADEIAERGIPVLVWPRPDGSGRPETSRYEPGLAADLDAAGVEVLFGSGGGTHSRDLRLLAAIAVGNGMDRDAALNALTLGPARAFDVADRIGSLERGKDGDVLVLDGDPLDTTSRIRFVISRGRTVVEQ